MKAAPPETNDPAAGANSAPPAEGEAVQHVNWGDFRDHIATADQEGRRQWIYPRKPQGRFFTARKWLSYLLLAVMFAGPFIHLNGNPLLLMNVVDRKFSVLGQMFWPQDGVILALGLLVFITGILVFTAAFGRLWCGWTCPQTIMMELVFRRIEYAIEGDAIQQRALDAAPWDARKLFKKGLKHAVFFGLSFVIGNTLLAYIIGHEGVFRIITDDPRKHLDGLGFMLLFTLVFYAIFARFREQACTFICPYGRFQSTVMDENTIVVAYDHKRGERRDHLRRGETPDARRTRGAGDCVDCKACVAICPTGIDIRNGTQMECVHCTACIDACDAVMDKVKRPRGLIRYASLNGIEKGEGLRVTPRIVVYSVILLLLGVVLGAVLLTRSDLDVTLLRTRGMLFQRMPDGKISNLYDLKLVNKTSRDLRVEVKIENVDGKLTLMSGNSVVPAGQLVQTPVLVEIAPDKAPGGRLDLQVGVYVSGRRVSWLKTVFIAPQSAPAAP